jgi:tetratricopeptide (TPR) repeat protein
MNTQEDRTASSADPLDLWRKAVSAAPDSSPAHYNLGLELAKAGQIRDAVREFQKASDLNPEDADSLSEIGRLEISAGRLGAATAALEKALARNPHHAGAQNNYGVVFFLKENFHEAARRFRAAAGEDPGLADAWYNLSDTCEELGDEKGEREAREHYRNLTGTSDTSGPAAPEQPPQRAEELIAEAYRQILELREKGTVPARVIMNGRTWEIIRNYRRSLGVLSGPVPDYLSEDELFGVEIWYGDSPGIRVE